ncbi:hypothetical protein PIB30_058731 [Stylosanthes scabra]|uniref:Uncharacterized protein n=1 Tax=Stylosanthes scabra TaxID=79078 RepID=A0ABU6TJU6_9FABA|nr:hypothetical protein [Stylosanthes scabra]
MRLRWCLPSLLGRLRPSRTEVVRLTSVTSALATSMSRYPPRLGKRFLYLLPHLRKGVVPRWRAQEILWDCDPLESIRWAEWAMIRAGTIMKSVEPRLTFAEEAERRNAKLLGDAKTLNLQKMVLEQEKADAIWAKLKVEEDLKALKAELETLEREKGAEIDRLRRREEGFLAEVEKFRGLAAEEKVRADLAETSVADLHKQCEDLAEDAKGAVAATEGALKAQLAIPTDGANVRNVPSRGLGLPA